MTRAEVMARVQQHRPDLAGESIAYLAEGDFCMAYLLSQETVVRIPKHGEAARALKREACVLSAMGHRLSAPVPAPEFLGNPDLPGESMAIHPWIPGIELTRDRWLAFPERDRVRLATAVGHFLQEIHALDLQVAEECGVMEVHHEGEIRDLVDRLKGPAVWGIPGDVRSSLRTCLREGLAKCGKKGGKEGGREGGKEGWGYRSALLHGDLSPGHVLVDEEGAISGIIDWGDVLIGDPARDFIFVYEDWGWDFLTLALEGYRKGGEGTGSRFRSRILLRYLVDQLEWTLSAQASGRSRDLAHGVEALRQGVRDFHRSQETPLP